MKKDVLEAFVRKYNLDGCIEPVKFTVDDSKQLRVFARTTDDQVYVDIRLNEFTDLGEMEFGVFETVKLKKMIAVLGETVEVSANINTKNKVDSITFKDDSVAAKFATADLSVIRVPTHAIDPPDTYDVEIELNKEFVTKFIKAKNALPDEDRFTLVMNKNNKLEMVIGYSKRINNNKITLNVKALNGKDSLTEAITFSANYFKEILNSNSDCENAVLNVTAEGLATVTFTKNDFISTYYLVAIEDVK